MRPKHGTVHRSEKPEPNVFHLIQRQIKYRVPRFTAISPNGTASYLMLFCKYRTAPTVATSPRKKKRKSIRPPQFAHFFLRLPPVFVKHFANSEACVHSRNARAALGHEKHAAGQPVSGIKASPPGEMSGGECNSGGPSRGRTCDRPVMSRGLYQLSYRPAKRKGCIYVEWGGRVKTCSRHTFLFTLSTLKENRKQLYTLHTQQFSHDMASAWQCCKTNSRCIMFKKECRPSGYNPSHFGRHFYTPPSLAGLFRCNTP